MKKAYICDRTFQQTPNQYSINMAKFKRILLKLSGESLMGEQGYGIDVKRLNEYAAQIKEADRKSVV